MNMNLTINNFRTLTAALAVTGICMTATLAHGADLSEGGEPAKKVVQYGDLNLANATAVERLYRRIVSAARDVCEQPNNRSLQAQSRARICLAQSVERAVAAVHQPALTSVYMTKTGRSLPQTVRLADRQ
jgi:UrcA family protein